VIKDVLFSEIIVIIGIIPLTLKRYYTNCVKEIDPLKCQNLLLFLMENKLSFV